MSALAPAAADLRTRRTAMAVLVGACVLWGLGFPVSRAIMLALEGRTGDAPLWAVSALGVGLRFLVATAILGVGLAAAGRLRGFTRLEFEQAAVLGGSVGVAVILQVMGLATIDASVSAFLTQLYAVIVPAAVAVRAGRWPGAATAGAVAAALVGAAWLAGLSPGQLHLGFGEALTVASAAFIAVQVIWLNRARYAGNDVWRMSLAMYAVVAAVGAAGLAAPDGFRALAAYAEAPAVGPMILAMGVFSTVVTFTLMNVFQPRIGAVEAGFLYTTEPVFAAAAAFVLPSLLGAAAGVAYANEAPGWSLLGGGLCVLAANVLVQIDAARALRRG